ncbi:hypothetical protein ACA910_016169 [Epithemia clementina (nom. ined.)]
MALFDLPVLADLPELPEDLEHFMHVGLAVLWWTYLPILAKFVFQFIMGLSLTFCYALRSWGPCKWTPRWPENPPRVTVIIPAYNEQVGITKTMKSVINTKHPNLEVIVVNDGSTDKTHEKVLSFIGKFNKENEMERLRDNQTHEPATIKYMQLVNGGKAAAMNQALRAVDETTDIVMTLDADSVMHKDYIRHMLDTFELYPQAGAVAGNVLVANRSKFIGIVQQVEYVLGFFGKRGDSVMSAVYIIGGAAAAYRRHVLEEVGHFDASIITEDIELSTRILACNIPTKYSHNAVVYTEGPSDWKGLANQRLRWKFGRFLTLIKQRELFFSLTNSNMYLCWVLLPMVIYMEAFLFFGPWLIVPFCLFYAAFMNALLFVYVLTILCVVVVIQVLLDSHRRFHVNLLILSPFNWLAALLIELIEWTALIRSLHRLSTGQGLKWQKWDRVGLSMDVGSEVDTKASGANQSLSSAGVISIISSGGGPRPPRPVTPDRLSSTGFSGRYVGSTHSHGAGSAAGFKRGPSTRHAPSQSSGGGSSHSSSSCSSLAARLPIVQETLLDREIPTSDPRWNGSEKFDAGFEVFGRRVPSRQHRVNLSGFSYNYFVGGPEIEDEADDNDDNDSQWWRDVPKRAVVI